MMFYAGAERHYVVEAILDSTTRGGTVIITAPEGGGVSTVLGYAAMRLVDYATVVRIDAEQVHSKNELMSSLLSYFDVPKDDFLSALNHALAQGPLVVLVDNGQQLSAELLELLAKLQQHFAGAFAVVVGGHAASTAEGRRGRAADALLYKEGCWLRERGVRTWDLMGAGSERTPELNGVGSFKAKFTSEGPVSVPGPWDLPVRPRVYAGLVKALELKHRAETGVAAARGRIDALRGADAAGHDSDAAARK